MCAREMSYSWLPRSRILDLICGVLEEVRPGEIIHFSRLIDAGQVERVREQTFTSHGVRPSYAAIVIKAVAVALTDFPYANRRVFKRLLGGRRLVQFEGIDAAVAVEKDLPGEPMLAYCEVIRRPHQLSLLDLTEHLQMIATGMPPSRQFTDFMTLARRAPSWVARWLVRLPVFLPALWVQWRGGSYLVSSPAKYGVDSILGSWQWPLGVSFGLVADRPIGREGRLDLAPSFSLSLNWDRKVMGGAQAARFFDRIASLLEEMPAAMIHGSIIPSEAHAPEAQHVRGNRLANGI